MSIRLGIIGAGAVGNEHSKAAAAAGVEVAGVCDLVSERAERLAARHPGAVATTELDELLAIDDMPAVVVAVPNCLHRTYAVTALDAGKDVLLEKPMAMTLAECDEILAARRRNDRIVQMNFVCRCAPAVAVVRDLMQAGRFGTIYHAKACWLRRRGVPGLGRWFTTKEQAGGGVLVDLGVHMIDLVMDLVGRPRAERVSGTCESRIGTPIDGYRYTEMWAGPPDLDGVFDVEDFASGLIRFETGLTLEVNTSWAVNLGENVVPSGIILLGDRGGCYFNIWGDRIEIASVEAGHLVDLQPKLPPGDQWAQAWCRQHETFARHVAARTAPEASAEDGRAVQAILEAWYRSSAEASEVTIER